jgi:hypothetical protein
VRAREFITEYRASHLYHATSWREAIMIWKDGYFRKGTSFTRMWIYAGGYAIGHVRESLGRVIFALDAERLRREFGRRNLQGYDWFQAKDPENASNYQRRDWSVDTDRAEERNLKPLPVKRYLSQVDIWLPIVSEPRDDISQADQKERYTRAQQGRDPFRDEDWEAVTARDQWMKDWLESWEATNVWEDMRRDPRVRIHPVARFPAKQQGVRLQNRQQYGSDHPAHAQWI